MEYLVVINFKKFLEQSKQSPDGYPRRETITEKLVPYLNDKKVTIISASYNMTESVANSIKKVLDLEFQNCPVPYCGEAEVEDFTKTLHDFKAESNQIDTLILVTTEEPFKYFPEYFNDKTPKALLLMWRQTLNKGGAFIINLINNTVKLITPDPIKSRQ